MHSEKCSGSKGRSKAPVSTSGPIDFFYAPLVVVLPEASAPFVLFGISRFDNIRDGEFEFLNKTFVDFNILLSAQTGSDSTTRLLQARNKISITVDGGLVYLANP